MLLYWWPLVAAILFSDVYIRVRYCKGCMIPYLHLRYLCQTPYKRATCFSTHRHEILYLNNKTIITTLVDNVLQVLANTLNELPILSRVPFSAEDMHVGSNFVVQIRSNLSKDRFGKRKGRLDKSSTGFPMFSRRNVISSEEEVACCMLVKQHLYSIFK